MRTAAQVNVPLGAHDIYDQEDMVIALTKLIASQLDINTWLLKTDGDHDCSGVARLEVDRLPAVQELRRERLELVRVHRGDRGVWASPDVQLLARGKLLHDLKVRQPLNCIHTLIHSHHSQCA